MDVCNRLTGQKFDPITNKLHDHNFYQIDDNKIVPKLDSTDFNDPNEEGLDEEDEDDVDSDIDSNDNLDDFNFDNVNIIFFIKTINLIILLKFTVLV